MRAQPAAVRRSALPGPQEIRVWFARTADRDPGSDRALLNTTERYRHDRLVRARDRDSFAAAHALLRTALSESADGVAPTEWQFRTEPDGRPELAGPHPYGDTLSFSLSHLPGAVAVVVTRGLACGVDVVDTSARVHLPALLPRSLTEAERSALLAAPEAEWLPRFHRLWALKEAYLKARGTGLLVSPNSVGFTLDPTPALAAEPRVFDAPLWQCWQRDHGDGYVVATAVRRPDARPLILMPQEAAPAQPDRPQPARHR